MPLRVELKAGQPWDYLIPERPGPFRDLTTSEAKRKFEEHPNLSNQDVSNWLHAEETTLDEIIGALAEVGVITNYHGTALKDLSYNELAEIYLEAHEHQLQHNGHHNGKEENINE